MAPARSFDHTHTSHSSTQCDRAKWTATWPFLCLREDVTQDQIAHVRRGDRVALEQVR